MSAAEPIHPLAGIARPGRHGANTGTPLRIALPRREFVQVAARRRRGEAVAAVAREALGLELPGPGPGRAAAGAACTAFWTQPNTWLLSATRRGEGALFAALAPLAAHAALVDQSHGLVAVTVAGAAARATLAKGCRLDLHARVFGPGQVAATEIAHSHVLLHQADAVPSFELILEASLAADLWGWLTASAAGFGFEVAA